MTPETMKRYYADMEWQDEVLKLVDLINEKREEIGDLIAEWYEKLGKHGESVYGEVCIEDMTPEEEELDREIYNRVEDLAVEIILLREELEDLGGESWLTD